MSFIESNRYFLVPNLFVLISLSSFLQWFDLVILDYMCCSYTLCTYHRLVSVICIDISHIYDQTVHKNSQRKPDRVLSRIFSSLIRFVAFLQNCDCVQNFGLVAVVKIVAFQRIVVFCLFLTIYNLLIHEMILQYRARNSVVFFQHSHHTSNPGHLVAHVCGSWSQTVPMR